MDNEHLHHPEKTDADEPNELSNMSNNDLFIDEPFMEETATEWIEKEPEQLEEQNAEQIDRDLKSMYGWLAIALSIISFFILPFIFAAAGIVFGIIARMREAPILGNTAIIIGTLSLLTRFFIMPLI